MDTVLVISRDSRFLHVASAEGVVGHYRLELHAPGAEPLTDPDSPRYLELYGPDGTPLRWQRAPRPQGRRAPPAGDLQIVAAEPSTPVPAAFLLDRIDAALAYMQVILNETGPPEGPFAPPPGTRIPRPTGSLEEVLDELAQRQGVGGGPNSGNWFHLVAHAAGLAHR